MTVKPRHYIPLLFFFSTLPRGHLSSFLPTSFLSASKTCSSKARALFSSSNGKDPFADFDPRISPHMYPNGIDGNKEPTSEKKKVFNINSSHKDYTKDDGPDVFDPRVSPHAYRNGIASYSVGYCDESQHKQGRKKRNKEKVGILLIDHGSRREESNVHLQYLAMQYQEQCDDRFVVRAAHMEIASPNIEDGIQALFELGVGKIVCHPYFLSPESKHASKDIPKLISTAQDKLSIDIPILTTDPVGSQVDVMIAAIGNAVQKSMAMDEVQQNSGSGKSLGFFDEIQRQMDSF